MPRIAFVGAGSAVFTRNLIGDVLAMPWLAGSTFALMDIDPQRLETSRTAAQELVAAHEADATVEATLDRRAAIHGADYVVTCFQVGGLESTLVDFEVPKRYGLRQTIGDTLGVGGISRALRTVPVLLDVCRDIEECCPDALLLQYVNPMAILCWALAERSPVSTVGLCHSVQHTTGELAADLGVPAEEVDAHVAGINHLAFFLRLERGGEDLYPALREVDPPDGNRVRYEVLRHMGAFVTESSEHFAEYVPWFIKADRPELIERFQIPLDEYVRRLREAQGDWDKPLELERSHEYGADIIRACETGEPFRFNGNMQNDGLIDNLPDGC
jgi:alpha-galactosidase